MLEVDLLLAHADGKPMMLIEAYPSREGKIRAQANEHLSPAGIVQIEAVLDDPALCHLKMPAILLLVAVGDQDAPWFSGTDNGHDLIRLGVLEVGVDETISPAIGWLQHRRAPLLRPVRDPLLVLLGNLSQFIAGDTLAVAIGVEESNDPFRLLKGLDQPVQQQSVEASVVEPDAILVVLEKSVHGGYSCVVRYQEHSAMNASQKQPCQLRQQGYQGRSPWLVSDQGSAAPIKNAARYSQRNADNGSTFVARRAGR